MFIQEATMPGDSIFTALADNAILLLLGVGLLIYPVKILRAIGDVYYFLLEKIILFNFPPNYKTNISDKRLKRYGYILGIIITGDAIISVVSKLLH